MSIYRNQLEDWLKQIDVQVESVLDVGGGEMPVKGRVRVWKVGVYKMLDNNAQFKPDYFYDMNRLIDLPVSFDVVFMLEVMEYIWNPLQALENVESFLKDYGVAYISFPTIYPLHNPQHIDYLRYYKPAIEKLLSEAKFSSWEITPRVATNGAKALNDFYRLEAMHPARGTEDIFHIGYCVKAIKGGGYV